MNKEEAIEQLYRLSLDWEENGLDTKVNQTDINAIKIIVSELDIANKKLDKIDTFIRGHQLFGMRFAKTLYRECLEYILSIIDGSDE
jgi:hypothetical protein